MLDVHPNFGCRKWKEERNRKKKENEESGRKKNEMKERLGYCVGVGYNCWKCFGCFFIFPFLVLTCKISTVKNRLRRSQGFEARCLKEAQTRLCC